MVTFLNIMINIISMKCKHCGYKWQPRIKEPKACPLCKQYLKKKEIAKTPSLLELKK